MIFEYFALKKGARTECLNNYKMQQGKFLQYYVLVSYKSICWQHKPGDLGLLSRTHEKIKGKNEPYKVVISLYTACMPILYHAYPQIINLKILYITEQNNFMKNFFMKLGCTHAHMHACARAHTHTEITILSCLLLSLNTSSF